MKIYHATSTENATNILIEKKIKLTNGVVYFCLERYQLENLILWWSDIGFKTNLEILELEINDISYTIDPGTKSFGGFRTFEEITIF